jgi:hypothetical protein
MPVIQRGAERISAFAAIRIFATMLPIGSLRRGGFAAAQSKLRRE